MVVNAIMPMAALLTGVGVAGEFRGAGGDVLMVCLGRLQVRVRCIQGLQRRQGSGSHGGARQAPQDQHHHQQKREAATHLQMIRALCLKFPAVTMARARAPVCSYTAM